VTRILVVEDEEHLAHGLRFNLEAEGYEVETVSDGRSAVERVVDRERSYDAVILDLTVPQGMGGKATVKELLATDPEAIVLISSGYIHDPLVTEHARHGFRGVLLKPYDLAELGKVLSAVLENR